MEFKDMEGGKKPERVNNILGYANSKVLGGVKMLLKRRQ